MWRLFAFSFLITIGPSVDGKVEPQIYDSYTGKILSKEEFALHKKKNTTFWCVNEVEPCGYDEGRRIDGSCNSITFPSHGSSHTPLLKILPSVFDKDFNLRKSVTGEDLPLPRKVRTTVLSEGRVPDSHYTHLLTYFALFMSADVLSFHDTINYLTWRNCCSDKGKSDPQCANQQIPDDDPVHRFSSERCQNLTKPWTFQFQCGINNSKSDRIITATPMFDLSPIYYDNPAKIRLFKDGLLKFEIEEGRVWPPSFKGQNDVCLLNQLPRETRCHDIGEESSNGILGTSLFTIWMWRHHNHIAQQLARLNPCWSDEMLFRTARDINIAVASQIFYYELNSLLLGEESLYQEGVLSPSLGFREIYDESLVPVMSIEYGAVLRWMHTIQEGVAKMYDAKGSYIKSFPIANLTLRTGFLADQNHIDYITQGAFRQAAAKVDYIVDPDMAEIGLGPLQRLSDILTNDLAKNRLFGLPPYISYRKRCFGEIFKTFDDLLVAMDPDRISLLRELYSHVEDVDLLAGVWSERPLAGARVPATFHCLVAEQLRRTVAADRHWYERRDRPAAFTLGQLLEVRKASVARLMCDIGDKVTHIQPHAFLVPAQGNEICSCEGIASIDYSAWKDQQCELRQSVCDIL